VVFDEAVVVVVGFVEYPGMAGIVILTVDPVTFKLNDGLYLRVSATPFQFPSSINFPKPNVHPKFPVIIMVIIVELIFIFVVPEFIL